MTAITAELVPERDVTYGRSAVSHFVTDVRVLTKRSIARIRREPETLADVTIMPVIFILMFAYVFGGAILLPGHGSYHEYLIGGMLGMGLAQTAPGVAVALVTDMSTGLMDRFRSLPMSRWAVLVARSIAELLTQLIGAAVVVCVGLAIGWRVHTGAATWPRRSRWRCCSVTRSPGWESAWAWSCAARRRRRRPGSSSSCR